MPEFTNLDQIYKYLNENLEIDDYLSVSRLFAEIKIYFEESNNSDGLQIAQWEYDFFSFRLVHGSLSPNCHIVNESGDTVGYPNIGSFEDETYDYLKARLETSSNPLIKARYAHLLWQSPKKHFQYAKIALEVYWKLVSIFEEKDKEEPEKHHGLMVLQFAETAYVISKNIKYDEQTIKSHILGLINNYSRESASVFALIASLIRLVISDKKLFTKGDLSGLDQICWSTAQNLLEADRIHLAIKFLELGEQVDRRSGKEEQKWRRKIAESYERMMYQRLEKGEPLAASHFCLNAIAYYKKIRDSLKEEELLKVFSEIKDTGKYAEFSVEIDLTEHVQQCREFANSLVQLEPEEILGFLVDDEECVLPNCETVKLEAKGLDGKFVGRKLFPITLIDQHGHPAKSYTEDNDKEYLGILEQYKRELELNKRLLIREIFFAAIKSEKIDANDIVEFLRKHSWIGKSLLLSRPNKEPISYNWLSLIAPSLEEYFLQMDRYLIIPNYQPSFILCIDSLVLKLEGLFRDFCRIHGVPTSSLKRDGTVQEKLIDELLREELILEKFSQDEVLFFKFVLIEKGGYNLRNRVAHSLMIYPEYGIDLIHYLILILLRLGKYDLISNGPDNS